MDKKKKTPMKTATKQAPAIETTAKPKPYQLAVRFIGGTDEVLFRVMKKLGKDRSEVVRWALLNFDREILFRELDYNGLFRDYPNVKKFIEQPDTGDLPGQDKDLPGPLSGFAKTARSGSR